MKDAGGASLSVETDKHSIALHGRDLGLAWQQLRNADLCDLAAHGVATDSEASSDRRHANRI